LKYDHSIENIEKDENEEIVIIDKEEKERLIAFNAWNFIKENENEESSEIQKIYLFSIVILGLLKHPSKMQKEVPSTARHSQPRNSLGKSKSVVTIHSTVTVSIQEKSLMLPDIDLNKYNYDAKIYNSIKTNFAIFYENRVNFLTESRKLQSENKASLLQPSLTFRPQLCETKSHMRDSVIRNKLEVCYQTIKNNKER